MYNNLQHIVNSTTDHGGSYKHTTNQGIDHTVSLKSVHGLEFRVFTTKNHQNLCTK